MVSTMAMHALMFEINWPLPCEVSVPSLTKRFSYFSNNKKKKKKKKIIMSTMMSTTHRKKNECMYANK